MWQLNNEHWNCKQKVKQLKTWHIIIIPLTSTCWNVSHDVLLMHDINIYFTILSLLPSGDCIKSCKFKSSRLERSVLSVDSKSEVHVIRIVKNVKFSGWNFLQNISWRTLIDGFFVSAISKITWLWSTGFQTRFP